MIFRRISEALKRQDWATVLIEFVLVILGVLIALQVNNWNGARIEHQKSRVYAQRILDDLETTQNVIRARLNYYRQTLAHGEDALRTLESEDAPVSTRLLVDLYQTSQIWPYSPQRATFDEILSAGIPEVIPDPAVRGRLANYYVNLANAAVTLNERTPYRENIRRKLPHGVQSAIRQQCNDIVDFQANGIALLSLPTTCDVDFEPSLLEQAAEALQSYPAVTEELARHLASIEANIAALDTGALNYQALRQSLEVLAQ